MNNKEYYYPNPFLKGYILDEDRKKKLTYTSGNYNFYSDTVDLYNGLYITFNNDGLNIDPDFTTYSHALADFMMWWEREIRQHLNGFSGFDTVKFYFINFDFMTLI